MNSLFPYKHAKKNAVFIRFPAERVRGACHSSVCLRDESVTKASINHNLKSARRSKIMHEHHIDSLVNRINRSHHSLASQRSCERNFAPLLYHKQVQLPRRQQCLPEPKSSKFSALANSVDALEIVSRIQNNLKYPQLANGDQLLSDFEQLAHSGHILPSEFFIRLLDVFCKRYDPWRIEIALRLAHLSTSLNNESDDMKSSAFSLILAHTISQLHLYNKQEYAYALWIRISNLSTNIKAFDQLISLSQSVHLPKISTVNAIHATLSSRLMTQNADHYANLLKSFNRSSIYKHLQSDAIINQAVDKLSRDLNILQLFASAHVKKKILPPEVVLTGTQFQHLHSFFSTIPLRLELLSLRIVLYLKGFDSPLKDEIPIRQQILKLFSKTFGGESNLRSELIGPKNDNHKDGNDITSSPNFNHKYVASAENGRFRNPVDRIIAKLSMPTQLSSSHDLSHSIDSQINSVYSLFGLMTKMNDVELLLSCFESYCRYCLTLSWNNTDDIRDHMSSIASRVLSSLSKTLKESESSSHDIQTKLLDLWKKMKITLENFSLSPSIDFYCCLLDNSVINIDDLLRTDSTQRVGLLPLHNDEDYLKLHECILNGMSGSKKPSSILQAFLYACKLHHNNINLSPEVWRNLTQASTSYLSDIDQSIFLAKLEELSKDFGLVGCSNSIMLEALLQANARQANAFKCIQILRVLRANNIQPSMKMYYQCLYAIYYSRPVDSSDWDLVLNPQATCNWMIRDLSRDGKKLAPPLIATMLKLYTKAVQILKSRGENHLQVIEQAEHFVYEIHHGSEFYPKVTVNEIIVSELIRACCVGESADSAMRIIHHYPNIYSYSVSATSFEPIFDMMTINHQPIADIEILLNQLVNSNISLSKPIVDAVVLSMRNHGQLSEASTRIQSLFTSYGKKPSFGIILGLLDDFLTAGNHGEAMRLVYIIFQLYNEVQRREAVVDGPNLSAFPFTGDFADSTFGDNLQSFDHYQKISSDTGSSFKLELSSSQLVPIPSDDRLSIDTQKKNFLQLNDEDATSNTDDSDAVVKRNDYRRKAFKGPREVGVFTEEALGKRFQKFGLTLDPIILSR
jgi:hypothetical protein